MMFSSIGFFFVSLRMNEQYFIYDRIFFIVLLIIRRYYVIHISVGPLVYQYKKVAIICFVVSSPTLAFSLKTHFISINSSKVLLSINNHSRRKDATGSCSFNAHLWWMTSRMHLSFPLELSDNFSIPLEIIRSVCLFLFRNPLIVDQCGCAYSCSSTCPFVIEEKDNERMNFNVLYRPWIFNILW